MPAKSGSKRRSQTAAGAKKAQTKKSAVKTTAKATRKTSAKPAGKSPRKDKKQPEAVQLSFRPRTVQDDEFILDLTQSELGGVHQQSFGEPFPREEFRRYLQSGAPTTIVSLKEKPIGYYSYLVGHEGKMHVSALVIHPSHQSDGVGTRVMEKLEKDARGLGVHTLEVFVQEVNAKSLSFTKKLGFVEVYRVPPNTVCFQKVIVTEPRTSAAAAPMNVYGYNPSGVQGQPVPGSIPPSVEFF